MIITRRDFFAAFDPLAKRRASQGIKTELIDIADIYDEFNLGNKSPQAVKDFLQYAKANWKTGPRFVLFGADSSKAPAPQKKCCWLPTTTRRSTLKGRTPNCAR